MFINHGTVNVNHHAFGQLRDLFCSSFPWGKSVWEKKFCMTMDPNIMAVTALFDSWNLIIYELNTKVDDIFWSIVAKNLLIIAFSQKSINFIIFIFRCLFVLLAEVSVSTTFNSVVHVGTNYQIYKISQPLIHHLQLSLPQCLITKLCLHLHQFLSIFKSSTLATTQIQIQITTTTTQITPMEHYVLIVSISLITTLAKFVVNRLWYGV